MLTNKTAVMDPFVVFLCVVVVVDLAASFVSICQTVGLLDWATKRRKFLEVVADLKQC